MVQTFRIKYVHVASGQIFIGDVDTINKFETHLPGWEAKLSNNIVTVVPGRYNCEYSLPHLWENRRVGGECVLEVTSGKIAVIDPCYAFNNDTDVDTWKKVIDSIESLSSTPGVIICDNMGGDGDYRVVLRLTKIEEGVI